MWDLAHLTSCIMTLAFYKREENLMIIKMLTALRDVIGLPTHFLFCSDTSPSLFQSSETPEALLPVSCLNNPSCLRGEMLPCPNRHLWCFLKEQITFKAQRNHSPLVGFPCQKESKEQPSYRLESAATYSSPRAMMPTLRALFYNTLCTTPPSVSIAPTSPVSIKMVLLGWYQSLSLTTRKLGMELLQP